MTKHFCFFLFFLAGFWAHSQTPGSDLLLQQGGHTRFDFGQNGCSEFAVPASVKVDMQDGDLSYTNYANPSTGTYAFLQGSYTVSPQLENPDYFSVSPNSAHVVIGPESHFVDFCISPTGSHPDAEVTIIPANQAVAGHVNAYHMVVRNVGNQTISGVAKLMFQAGDVEYISAQPTPNVRTTRALQWNYNNLQPFESRVYRVELQVSASANGFSANGGAIGLTANVTSAEQDQTPANNIFDLRQQILASSFGPNNKICLEGEIAPPAMIGQYLNYVINFENTGSSVIQKVVINDEIDTNQFELNSLIFTNMSHPGIPIVIGNKIEIYFQDINLQPGAQGHAAFKIKTKSTIPVGSTVSNKAKIYFDFNFPIETNNALTTFQVLGLPEVQVPIAKVFPNPGNGMVTIESNQEMLLLTIADAQGRTIGHVKPNTDTLTLDISGYNSGLYCLKIVTANGTLTRKLIKQ